MLSAFEPWYTGRLVFKTMVCSCLSVCLFLASQLLRITKMLAFHFSTIPMGFSTEEALLHSPNPAMMALIFENVLPFPFLRSIY